MRVPKPALHGRDNRDDAADPIAGPWQEPVMPGDPNPDDLPELENDWAQPSPPLETFAYRRDMPRLAFKGHLDASGASSGTVALTLPDNYRLMKDQFWHTTITPDDGASFSLALVFIESSTGEVTITWPAT